MVQNPHDISEIPGTCPCTERRWWAVLTFFCLGFLFEAFVCFLFPDFDVFEVPDYTGLFPNTLHCVTCSTLHD